VEKNETYQRLCFPTQYRPERQNARTHYQPNAGRVIIIVMGCGLKPTALKVKFIVYLKRYLLLSSIVRLRTTYAGFNNVLIHTAQKLSHDLLS
jgi:hypothetical protein